MDIVDQPLGKGEFYLNSFQKNTIYLHHTAGGHRPDWVVHGWDVDDDVVAKKARIVATAFVIGGISTTDLDNSFDGKIYRAFPEECWAHHLGLEAKNNAFLNQQSVAIELCNYGPLKKGSDGKFYNYVSKPVPSDMVVELSKPYRGYIFYHKYTDKQIESLKELLLYLKGKFTAVPFKTPLISVDGFESSGKALKGEPGIYSHSNVRNDKFDLFPQPSMIEMLKSITS